MRIISGKFGGRKLEVPKGRDIRPTSDKVRGSIFNALGSRMDLDGAQVMDVFCGTGALGLEALSRGAGQCIFVDKVRDSLDLARRNAAMFGLDWDVEFILSDAVALRPRGADTRPVDLVFCDPPYHQDLIVPCLNALVRGNWLAVGAYCVLEAEKGWPISLPPGFEVVTEKTYGDTCVVYARRTF